MEEFLGCWFNDVFILCDNCKYGSDTDGCTEFMNEFLAKYGYLIV